MARLAILALAVVVVATAACVSASHHGHHGHGHHDYHTKPKYHYKYGVDDPKHGDHHSQWEERDGDKVKGGYSVKEADGTWRHVTYTSDKENGFNAVVERHGKATHPHHYHHHHDHHDHHDHHGHHGHLKAAAEFISAKGDFASGKALAKADASSATHESLENYPDGAYGYIG